VFANTKGFICWTDWLNMTGLVKPWSKNILRPVLVIFLVLLSFSALAIEPHEDAVQAPSGEDETALDEFLEEADAEADIDGNQPWVDTHKESVDTRVEQATLWVDGFFNDPNYEAEAAYSQIRLRPELYYRKEQGAKAEFRFRARINLPNIGRRASLVVGAEDEDDFNGSADDSSTDGTLGLQYFIKESARWNTSVSAGIKFNDFAFYLGPRFRFKDTVGEKGSYRFTQTIRWQTNNYWQFNSRLDLNRLITDKLYFRQTFDGRWRGEEADEIGYRTRVSSFLTQNLTPVSGIQYQFSTTFHTEPDTHVYKYALELRYRKQTKRDWLYYEIIPLVSFDKKYDYKFNPGIRLRLEFFFGRSAARQFWREEAEDSEQFSW
jgi:hypothetical protein